MLLLSLNIFVFILGILKIAMTNNSKTPNITGIDFNLYLKKKKVITANAVPMILVRNTHKIQGIINRTHNNKSFFSFPP